jgi:hypothetical protein
MNVCLAFSALRANEDLGAPRTLKISRVSTPHGIYAQEIGDKKIQAIHHPPSTTPTFPKCLPIPSSTVLGQYPFLP